MFCCTFINRMMQDVPVSHQFRQVAWCSKKHAMVPYWNRHKRMHKTYLPRFRQEYYFNRYCASQKLCKVYWKLHVNEK